MNKTDSGFVDLHVHTTFSDGMFTPEKVVKKAIELGMRAIAITDHDCVDGITPAIEAAAGTSLEIIPGVEVSAIKKDTEIHILGYFIDWLNPQISKRFQRMKDNRVKRMKKMINLLKKEGLKVTEAEVFDSVKSGTVGRLHLARVMLKNKCVRNLKEAFDNYIGDGKPCCVRHERLDYRKAIDFIRASGGVPVIAHPATMGKDEFIPSYKRAGLRGLEVYHSKQRGSSNAKYLKMAKEQDLIVTGGSDCHGMEPGKVLLGKVKVGYEVVTRLREESIKIKGGKSGRKTR